MKLKLVVLKRLLGYDNLAQEMLLFQDVAKLHAKGTGTLSGRLLVGTAEKIPSSELVDTTGAGDAFVGAVLYCT